jgi:RHS repeat-associated protein
VTDAVGNVLARHEYDPYGRRTLVAGTDLADFGYTGHYVHQPSGLHLALYRAYDADLGRWLNRDPIGEAGGINLYGYVLNDPVNWLDLFGLAPGDKYGTLDAAAIAACDSIRKTTKFEWGGYLYKNPDGTYSYTAARSQGFTDTCSPEVKDCPKGTTPAGIYHNHPAVNDSNYVEGLSEQDMIVSDIKKIPVYVIESSGAIYKHDPCKTKLCSLQDSQIRKPNKVPEEAAPLP